MFVLTRNLSDLVWHIDLSDFLADENIKSRTWLSQTEMCEGAAGSIVPVCGLFIKSEEVLSSISPSLLSLPTGQYACMHGR